MRPVTLLPALALGCLFDAGERDERRDALRPPAPTSPAPTTPTPACPGGGDPVETWPDLDGDQRGDDRVPSELRCPGDDDRVANHLDCDDGDAALPGPLFVDGDGDGVGGEATAEGCPGPGTVAEGGDCDDGLPGVSATSLLAVDDDGDGFGAPGTTTARCAVAGGGYAANELDCDDGAADVFPVALFADLDSDGVGGEAVVACPGPGLVDDGGDCDDRDSRVSERSWPDLDGDGHGDPAGPVVTGCPTDRASRDQLDCDDTDGSVPQRLFTDADADGYGAIGTVTWSCVGGVAVGGDCDDAAPDIHPGAIDDVEALGAPARDEDCDGVVALCGVHRIPRDMDDYQAQIDAACPGDVFELERFDAGPRSAGILLDGVPNLTIRPAGNAHIEIYVTGTEPAFRMDDDHLENLTISAFRPVDDGGAVVVTGPDASLVDVHFEGGSGNFGGAIYADGAHGLLLDRVSFVDVDAIRGGAAYVVDSDDIVLRDVFLDCAPGDAGTLVGGLSLVRSPRATFDGLQASGCEGSALDIDASDVATFLDSAFGWNHNNYPGGAVQLQGTAGVFVDTTFDHNSSNSSGGAIWADATSPLSVTRGEFTDNAASSVDGYVGGAIGAQADVGIGETRFAGNRGGAGGALHVSGAASVQVTGARFEGNHATGPTVGTGGALAFDRVSDMVLNGATFEANDAVFRGGAIAVTGGSLAIADGSFSGDLAPAGGAVHAEGGADLALSATRFVDTQATSGFGHVLTAYGVGDVAITDSTLDDLRASPGTALSIDADDIVLRRITATDLDAATWPAFELLARDILVETVTVRRVDARRVFELRGDSTITNLLVADDVDTTEGIVRCVSSDCDLDFVTLLADSGPGVVADQSQLTATRFALHTPYPSFDAIDGSTVDLADGVLWDTPTLGIVWPPSVAGVVPTFVDPPDDCRLAGTSVGVDADPLCTDLDGSACDYGAYGGPLAVP